MKNTQKGFLGIILVLAAAIVLLGTGGYVIVKSNERKQPDEQMTPTASSTGKLAASVAENMKFTLLRYPGGESGTTQTFSFNGKNDVSVDGVNYKLIESRFDEANDRGVFIIEQFFSNGNPERSYAVVEAGIRSNPSQVSYRDITNDTGSPFIKVSSIDLAGDILTINADVVSETQITEFEKGLTHLSGLSADTPMVLKYSIKGNTFTEIK